MEHPETHGHPSVVHDHADADTVLGLRDHPHAPREREIEVDPVPAGRAESLPAPGPISRNALFNLIADEQGVPVGSWDWLQGGVAAFSGQSGQHASYGWTHVHKIDEDYVRSVIANYGHRPTFYDNALHRRYGYDIGGRPVGYKPSEPGDNANGSKSYLVNGQLVEVSGPEVEHFWLEPLWEVIDAPRFEVDALGTKQDSRDIARVIATYQMRSLIGQIRDPNSPDGLDPFPWGYGDRGNSRIISSIIEAAKRGCIEKVDADTAWRFIVNVALPFYERAPGVSKFGAAPAGKRSVGCFNGIYWLLPVFWDAAMFLPQPFAERFFKLCLRLSQWALDLESQYPGRGFNMSRFYVNALAFESSPEPVATLQGQGLNVEAQFDEGLAWETWAFRAACVAAEVLQSETLADAANGILQRRGGNPDNRVWLTGADRNPIRGQFVLGDPTRPVIE